MILAARGHGHGPATLPHPAVTHGQPHAGTPGHAAAPAPIHPAHAGVPGMPPRAKFEVRGLNFYYGSKQALHDINIAVLEGGATSLIGPSGCGKSTFLRTLNRMNDTITGARHSGTILLDGEEVHTPCCDVVRLRRRVGMVFQKSNPFPKSIFDNVAFGPRLHGRPRKEVLADVVERSLRRAALWDEVRDRLHESALSLSGGQQQRLCIARALAVEPEVLLMDEPCSALDPASTLQIEELIHDLKHTCTIIIVTHNMQQASRVSDHTAFFCDGHLIEQGPTQKIFRNPEHKRTSDYVNGRFG